jgi:elongation factor P
VASIQATSLRRGTVILHEGVPYKVLEFQHRTPARQRGFMETKLRNLLDGTQRQVKFWATDTVERARIEAREMDFLYRDGSGFVFMDAESYEQLTLDEELVGDGAPWLADGTRVVVEFLDGERPIGVSLPKVVEIRVREAEAVIKGQTAARSSKPATLDNGVTLQVPTFIEAGDRVRVDPSEPRYLERVK